MVQGVAGAFEPAGPALHGDATETAVLSVAEFRQGIEAQVDVVRDEQVEMSVVVVVAEGGPGRPAGIADSGARRDIGERAIAIVAEEMIGAEAGDVEVFPAVVVVITGRYAHRPARVTDASSRR